MKNSQLAKRGFLYAFGTVLYIFLVAVFMNNASRWFGEEDKNIVSPMAFLLLFLFSALVTSSLVLGKPIMLYLDGEKKDGVKQLMFTGLGIFIFMLIVFAIHLIIK